MNHQKTVNDMVTEAVGKNSGELVHSSLTNLLLLPPNYEIKEGNFDVQSIFKASSIFRKLYNLERSIQPILAGVEGTGLIVSNEWFTQGLASKQSKLQEASLQLSNYVGGEGGNTDPERIGLFCRHNHLPHAYNREDLAKYKQLHPIYDLLLESKKQQQFLKQWGTKLQNDSQAVEGGILLKGHWQSYVSYTGRIAAKNLPLTSIPKIMRDYIVAPEGYQIISLDFNAAEMRFLGYYANCQPMLEQFEVGRDVHTDMTDLIQKTISKRGQLDAEVGRSLTKEYIYSFLYGAGRNSIADKLRRINSAVTTADVVEIENEFNRRYPTIAPFILSREQSEKLLTPFGELKPLATFRATQKRNFALQTSVAVAVKFLMVEADKYWDVIHVIHDELWLVSPVREPPESVLAKIQSTFYPKIAELFPGFPIEGLITCNIIGGKNHDK